MTDCTQLFDLAVISGTCACVTLCAMIDRNQLFDVAVQNIGRFRFTPHGYDGDDCLIIRNSTCIRHLAYEP